MSSKPKKVEGYAPETEEATAPEVTKTIDYRQFRPQARHLPRLVTIGLPLLLLAVVVALLVWRAHLAQAVVITQPKPATITETITSSGRVSGHKEIAVGVMAPGVVQSILVKEGDRVTAGQQLAVLKNDVSEAQAAQARAAVETARAQLAEVSSGPLQSEIETAAGQAQQAGAQLAQQQAALMQAEEAVSQSRAQLSQLEAERDLAAKQLERNQYLLSKGLISKAEVDRVEKDLKVEEARVVSARRAIEMAQANVRAAQAGVKSAQANAAAFEARLRTTRIGSTPEKIRVARQRLLEAEQALRVAEEQARQSIVTAPFTGIVTTINTELGETVGQAGVVQLVSSDLEIRLDLDENNLADLALGQEAIISSDTFPGSTFQARVSEIAAAVDRSRGTVRVTVKPVSPPDWLRPGQTVNVNVVTSREARRLVIPTTALTRAGDRSAVLVVENGHAVEKMILTRPPTREGVPVLAGLDEKDRVIADVKGIKPGDPVRVR
jgi:HlyD family secretion protein